MSKLPGVIAVSAQITPAGAAQSDPTDRHDTEADRPMTDEPWSVIGRRIVRKSRIDRLAAAPFECSGRVRCWKCKLGHAADPTLVCPDPADHALLSEAQEQLQLLRSVMLSGESLTGNEYLTLASLMGRITAALKDKP